MVTLRNVLEASLALMDAIDQADSVEYEERTPGILNALLAERRMLLGLESSAQTLGSVDEQVPDVSDDHALSTLASGLAAHLLLDENPYLSGYFLQRYQEGRDNEARKFTQESTDDIYGGLEYGSFGHW